MFRQGQRCRIFFPLVLSKRDKNILTKTAWFVSVCIFFSHFEGTRGEKKPNISHLMLWRLSFRWCHHIRFQLTFFTHFQNPNCNVTPFLVTFYGRLVELEKKSQLHRATRSLITSFVDFEEKNAFFGRTFFSFFKGQL